MSTRAPLESSTLQVPLEMFTPMALPSVAWEDRKTLPKMMALYFVLDASDKVLYIGQTADVSIRLRYHHHAQRFLDLSVSRIAYFAMTDLDLLNAYEVALIAHFRPPLNTRLRMPYTRSLTPKGPPWKALSLKLPQELLDALNSLHRDHGISRNGFIVQILRAYVAQEYRQRQAPVGV